MHRFTHLACSLVVLVGAAAPARPATPGEVHAIENTTVWVGDGTVLEGVHVILRDGLIEAIGVDVAIPPEATHTDGEGLTVYPGWMDAYSTTGVVIPPPPENAPLGNAGVEPNFTQESQPRTREANRRGIHPERHARDFLNLAEADAKALREAGFTHLVAAPPEGYLRGLSCVIDVSGAPPRRSVVGDSGWTHAHLRERNRGGYPGTLMANLAHVRQTFHDARRLRSWQELERRHPLGTPRAPDDSALQALAAALDGVHPVAFEADSENDILRALKLAEEFHLHPMIVGGREAWRLAERLAADHVPVIVALDFPDEPEREGAKKKSAKDQDPPSKAGDESGSAEPATPPGTDVDAADTEAEAEDPESTEPVAPSEAPPADAAEGEDAEDPADPVWEIEDPINAEPLKLFEERVAEWQELVHNAAVLHDAGVEIALTTLGSKPDEFVADLRRACEQGLDPAAALAALTVVPAKLSGHDQHLGQVVAGMTANLTLIAGEPFAKDRTVRYTFVAGQRFEGKSKKDSKSKGGGGAGAGALAGTWTIRSGEEDREFTLVIEADGDALGGRLKSDMGEWELASASLEGDEFHIVVDVEFNTESFEFVLKGKLEGDVIRGTFETPFGEPSDFEGQRKPQEGR